MKRVLPFLIVLAASAAYAQPAAPPVTPPQQAAPTGASGTAQTPPVPGVKAWYDQLADKPIEEEGTFWLPKAVNQAADESFLLGDHGENEIIMRRAWRQKAERGLVALVPTFSKQPSGTD